MEILPAKLVREVDPSEQWDEVVNEAKMHTWTHRSEHALLRVEDGRLLLVRGGKDGIEFELKGTDVLVRVDGVIFRVVSLAWHTHPRPTGPSDHDRRFLRLLGQPSSIVYEMFADGTGTRFTAEDREVD